MREDEDFYEDDEPIDKIRGVFARGTRHLTRPARQGFIEVLTIPGAWQPLQPRNHATDSNRSVGVPVTR